MSWFWFSVSSLLYGGRGWIRSHLWEDRVFLKPLQTWFKYDDMENPQCYYLKICTVKLSSSLSPSLLSFHSSSNTAFTALWPAGDEVSTSYSGVKVGSTPQTSQQFINGPTGRAWSEGALKEHSPSRGNASCAAQEFLWKASSFKRFNSGQSVDRYWLTEGFVSLIRVFIHWRLAPPLTEESKPGLAFCIFPSSITAVFSCWPTPEVKLTITQH